MKHVMGNQTEGSLCGLVPDCDCHLPWGKRASRCSAYESIYSNYLQPSTLTLRPPNAAHQKSSLELRPRNLFGHGLQHESMAFWRPCLPLSSWFKIFVHLSRLSFDSTSLSGEGARQEGSRRKGLSVQLNQVSVTAYLGNDIPSYSEVRVSLPLAREISHKLYEVTFA